MGNAQTNGSGAAADAADALFNAALRKHVEGDLAGARALYAQVLEAAPRHAGALNNLGLALKAQGRPAEALGHFSAALAADPAHTEAGFNLGNTLVALSRPAESLAHFAQALQAQPANCGAHVNLGNALMALGQHAQAVERFEAALAIQPGNARVLANLGGALGALGNNAQAAARLAQALELRPDLAETRVALGNLLRRMDRNQEALAEYKEALAIRPDFAEAHNNLGSLLGAQLRTGEAIAHFDRALALQPGMAEAESNKSLALLRAGNYKDGWPLYESRWRRADMRPLAACAPKLWLGEEAIEGRALLIQHEQGLGDALQMLRYIPLLEGLGARCLIQTQPALQTLARRSFPQAAVVERDACPPQAAFRIPLMSLPLALGTRSEADIPQAVPYIEADANKSAAWAARIEALGRPAVGLAWRGNPAYAEDRNRSIRLHTLLPLIARSELHYFVLHKDLSREESAALSRHPNVTRLPAGEDSLDDVAALMRALDAVVSVDTALAHLAGALGRPVWVLLAHNPTWVWQLGRKDCPWYPTARLLRQAAAGDWDGVMLDLYAGLHGLASAGNDTQRHEE